jgi:hypothetical protein
MVHGLDQPHVFAHSSPAQATVQDAVSAFVVEVSRPLLAMVARTPTQRRRVKLPNTEDGLPR